MTRTRQKTAKRGATGNKENDPDMTLHVSQANPTTTPVVNDGATESQQASSHPQRQTKETTKKTYAKEQAKAKEKAKEARQTAAARRPLKDSAAVNKRIAELEWEIEKANANASRYKRIAKKAKSSANAKSGQADGGRANKTDHSIPKPRGRPLRIQEDLGLAGQDDEWDRLRADPMVPWTQQPLELRGQIVEVVHAKEPLLRRCAGDWGTQAIIIQYLGNHIGYKKRAGNPNSKLNIQR